MKVLLIFISANNIGDVITCSTDEDLGLWIESSGIIKTHGVSIQSINYITLDLLCSK